MEQDIQLTPLPASFYNKSTLELARALLGCILVNQTEEGNASGIIVETEAYLGAIDQAAHSFQNRRTKRTEIMYGKAGLVYTYAMHTHCLVNVVSSTEENPKAVLIRAVEPHDGIDLMYARRPVTELRNLTSGPGKLTKALGITMDDYGRSFTSPPLFLAKGIQLQEISQGKRIGIANSGEAKDYPWRFWVSGNKFVSK